MDGFSDPITWSRNFDDEEVDEEESMELPKVEFVVRITPLPLSDVVFSILAQLYSYLQVLPLFFALLKFTPEGKAMAQEGKLKTKLLLIGVRTAASVFLHATFESKTLLGDIVIEGVSTSVR